MRQCTTWKEYLSSAGRFPFWIDTWMIVGPRLTLASRQTPESLQMKGAGIPVKEDPAASWCGLITSPGKVIEVPSRPIIPFESCPRSSPTPCPPYASGRLDGQPESPLELDLEDFAGTYPGRYRVPISRVPLVRYLSISPLVLAVPSLTRFRPRNDMLVLSWAWAQ